MDVQVFCTECGTKLEEKTTFCTNCGTAINGSTETRVDLSRMETARPVQTSVPRHWMAGGLVAALVALLGVMAYQYYYDGSGGNAQPGLKLPGGKPRLIGQWYRVTELQLGESEDLPFIELFKDNTLLNYESRGEYKGKYPGTWTDLEDGRVKMQVTSPLGSQKIIIGKLDEEGMLLESHGRYVNGLDQAKAYVLKSVRPTIDTVMELIDRADKYGRVSQIRMSGKPGTMVESGINCKDYTAHVEYTLKTEFGFRSRNVEGFVCLDRNEKGAFKLAQQKLKCVDDGHGSPKDCFL